jgi:Spy/CpxP family protein refolding chaperone
MKVRLALLGMALVALSATAAPAQNPPPGGPGGPPGGGMGNRRMQMMLTGITLTAQQQATVDSIAAAFRAQMPAFTPGAPPDSAARAQRLALSARQDSTIRKLLTPEQQAIWDRNAEQARNMPRRPPSQ